MNDKTISLHESLTRYTAYILVIITKLLPIFTIYIGDNFQYFTCSQFIKFITMTNLKLSGKVEQGIRLLNVFDNHSS